ncbi:MAG: radical SAM protein [Candidatus Omnitrophica bacterium]|nr:radical SAM protein [Candidatus Omnitrophota bacterium]
MKYQGTVIRPPSEAESLILQVTLGCSDNSCSFCPAYKLKKFKIRNIADIEKDIIECANNYPDTQRIFLADGDAMIIPMGILENILDLLDANFPRLRRIGIYASAKSLVNKSVNDLVKLKNKKIGIIYLGIETGDEEVYKNINKWGNPEKVKDECLKVKESGIKLNTTVVLGLGGQKLSEQHSVNTAKLLNQIHPDQVAALTLMIVKGTEIYNQERSGEFTALDKRGFLKELFIMVNNLEDFSCLFFSNHASNYFPISARFPKEKAEVLSGLKQVIDAKDDSTLRSEWTRGL